MYTKYNGLRNPSKGRKKDESSPFYEVHTEGTTIVVMTKTTTITR